MDYSLELSEEASQQHDSLTEADKKKVDRGLARIRGSPIHVPGRTELLRGRRRSRSSSEQLDRTYRYRTNGLRIFYVVNSDAKVVSVLAITRRTTTTYRGRS